MRKKKQYKYLFMVQTSINNTRWIFMIKHKYKKVIYLLMVIGLNIGYMLTEEKLINLKKYFF